MGFALGVTGFVRPGGYGTFFPVFNNSAFPTPTQEPTGFLAKKFSIDPLNVTYSVDGRTVRLHDRRSEIRITPHSATTMKLVVYSKSVYGDLDRAFRKKSIGSRAIRLH